MKKRIIGIMLSLALMLTMMPVLGLSQTAYADIVEYPLYVGGVHVDDEHMAGNGWSYNATDNKLTLNGASITEYTTLSSFKIGIYYSGKSDLTIELASDSSNSIGLDKMTPHTTGIYASNSKVTFTGAGSLEVVADMDISANNAVFNEGTINLDGANSCISATSSVEITGGNVTATASAGNGIYAKGTVAIGKGASLIATGSNYSCVGTVKNAIPGKGWTEGSEDPTIIQVNTTEGQDLSNYKKIQFLPVEYPLWVGNTQVTSANEDDVLNDGGKVKFTPATTGDNPAPNTLTLDGAKIDGLYASGTDKSYANIHSKGIDLKIELKGQNTVDSTSEGVDPARFAIDVQTGSEEVGGNLTIDGNGTGALTANGKDTAIYAEEACVINDCSIIATSSYEEAIWVNDGDCTISGADIEACSSNDDAIYIDDGKCVISDAELSVEAKNGDGIYTWKDLTINGNVEARGTSHGIISSYGSVTINGGNVTATGENMFGIDADDDLTINGGTVTATGARAGLFTWDGSVTANGGTIIATETGGGEAIGPTSIDVASEPPVSAGIATSNTVIGKDVVSLISSGKDMAISGKVKNEIAGTGWESEDGSGTKTAIAVNTSDEGQELPNYKKVQFPAKVDPTPVPTPDTKAPTVKTTAKASEGSVTIEWKWDKVNEAKGYKVAYRKVGSKKWTTKTTKKTKYVVKGHKLKGLYEYKVAAVTNSGNVWSKVSRRYFNNVKAKAKAGKGSIKISWKKDKSASEYQVLLATNKKMKNAQKIKVEKSAKSYKFSGLEKGKKYYVAVRPMKSHQGVTYKGIRCKAHKLKVK